MCTAAVWGLLLGLRTWTSARQRRRPRPPFPQPSSATRVRKISTRPCFASRPRATSSTTRSSRRASRRMTTRSCSASRPRERRVLLPQARVDLCAAHPRKLGAPTAVRPIDLESSDEEDTDVEDMRVGKTPRFAPHRLLSDSALTLRATNQATGVLKQKTPAEPLISPAPPQAAIKKIAQFLSPDKKIKAGDSPIS